MNREQVLAILYEMAIVIGGEIRLKPLLTKTLQRLLFHTSFPCGMVFLETGNGEPGEGGAKMIEAKLEMSIGDYDLARHNGTMVKVPQELLVGGATMGESPELVNLLPCRKDYYNAFLRLPLEDCGVILLIAPRPPATDLPLSRIFQPVIDNFAKAIILCLSNESYTESIISDRRRAEAAFKELELANNKLQELDHLKSMFIASMSHELRTPLNSIIGFSSILHDEWLGPVNAEQKENLAIILQSGKHLLTLINDVIDVSKIEAGKVEAVIEEFRLQEVIAEAVNLVRNDARGKGLEIIVRTCDAELRMDKRRLLQCVINLLSNAVKFTHEGSIAIDATISHRRAPSGETVPWIDIAVTDTGIGIKAEEQEQLFSPFVRLVAPHQSTIPGTGLGLYLTRRLATEVLQGEVLLTSEYGKGSTFTLRLPARTAP